MALAEDYFKSPFGAQTKPAATLEIGFGYVALAAAVLQSDALANLPISSAVTEFGPEAVPAAMIKIKANI